MEQKPLKLHLGCGEKYLEGYVNIDFPPSEHSVLTPKVDIYHDIRTLEYPDNSIDEIQSHHLFEHFSRTDGLKLLFRWRKWLKPDGMLVIETPDFYGCAAAYAFALTQKRRMELGRHMLGSQEAKWAYHLDFWDKPKFKFVFARAGFKNLKFREYQNGLAQHYPGVPFLNIMGNLLPNSFYKKHGSHKLPNILVIAQKDGAFDLNEDMAAEEILREYLVGREGENMLKSWLADYHKELK